MATWWRLEAVMEAASLRQPAVIEPEDRRVPRSGCVEEKTESMRQASNASSEREAVKAHYPEEFGSPGARGSKGQQSPLRVATHACEQEIKTSAPHALMQPSLCKPLSTSRCASSPSGSRMGLLSKTLPNPSLKPRPNGKTQGPRYSAGLLLLQRGPCVLPSVPA